MFVRVLRKKTSGRVELVPLFQYICGVVAAEMYLDFETETFKAQAVAAMTYVINMMRKRVSKKYDVTDGAATQAYEPERINDRIEEAVKSVFGEVLLYDSEVLDNCKYTACNGGYMQSALEHYGKADARPYLVGKVDTYDKLSGKSFSGHGVGMSQQGANQRAKAGHTYKEILAWYYAGTVIDNIYDVGQGRKIDIKAKLTTNNQFYNTRRSNSQSGIAVHSTAAPGVMAERFAERFDVKDAHASVHFFIDDKNIVQCLPLYMRAMHCGGKANGTHVSFEICEPSGFKYEQKLNERTGKYYTDWYNPKTYNIEEQQPYFEATWNNALDLCVYLCKRLGLTPNDIISHAEGFKLGIASNHADVGHWWHRHGKTMEDFRKEVAKRMGIEYYVELSTKDKNYKKTLVKKLQQALADMNFDIGGIDGYYGKKTRDAVKAFQKANDLKQTGIADVKTQALLYGDIVEEPEEPAVVDNKEAILEQIDKLREMVKGL